MFIRALALAPPILSLLAGLLLFACPAQAVTFGRYQADLLPAPAGQEGLDLVRSMVLAAAQRATQIDRVGQPVTAAVPSDMVALPAGGLAMGSRDEDGTAAEHPRHWVQLDAFALDRTEVTRAAYLNCVAAGRCVAPASLPDAPTVDVAQPVTGVRWQDAADYCAWAGKRLPTEAQWEYAARSGGRDQVAPWGNEPANCRRAWMTRAKAGCDEQRMTTACTLPDGASAQGVCDLIGNVWEWTADWYAPYGVATSWNPRGPDAGLARVVRGGSWLEFALSSRAAARGPRDPETRAVDVGFRCAMPLTTSRDGNLPPATDRAALVGDSAAWPADSSPHTDAATGIRYVWFPAGKFHFGCEARDNACFADEKPGTEEAVDGFWFAERDVTAEGYQRCVDAGVCGAANVGGSCNARAPTRQQHPANCLSWYQAELFCRWAGARLPSAIEWEYAAKGGEGRIFPWGDADVDATRLNYCDKRCGELHPDWMWPDKLQDDGWNSTSPVGSFPAGASKQGLLDLVGNAAQWTTAVAGLPARQVRGGGWDLYARYLRNTSRTTLPPSHWFDNVTVRCAR